MIRLFNDTRKTLNVRINIKDSVPSNTTVEPQKCIAIFTKTDDVLVKLWEGNVLLIQDRG